MNFSWYTRLLLALAGGVALALAFPNYNLPLLAWVSIAPLILASWQANPRIAPLYGFLHGVVFYQVSVAWIQTVIHHYGNVDSITAAALLLLMGFAGGVIVGIFSWAIAITSKRGPLFACALAPFLWVTLEFARARLPIIGFPWNLLGFAAGGNLALVQLTTITGIYGLSFVVAAWSSLLAYAILSGRQRAWKVLIATTAALILIAVSGRYLVPHAQARYVAHLVQTNFAQSFEYPPDWMPKHAADLDELEKISVDAGTKVPGLIVWPEVPAPFSLQESDFNARAQRIARDSGQDLVVGVEDWKTNAEGKFIATNSAVLLLPSGQRAFTYDKIHLVPWGEYVPLRHVLSFAGKLTADIGDFTPGTEYRVGQLPGGTFSTFICYEAIFPNEIRHFADNGAELLINMSNDGWFGRSAAPAQHVMMSRVRAVESRRWLLRDTNNGFTEDFDPYGRLVAQLPTDIRGELDAPYDFRSDLTIYARFGDWFAYLCVIASIAIFGSAVLSRSTQTRIST